MMGDLARRVAVVVGGGQTSGETVGNGRAACLVYAGAGARVLVVDRDVTVAERTVALVRESGGVADSHQADITSEADCRGIAEAASAAFGAIDILHNNVGIVPAGATEELTHDGWRAALDVNLTGMWLTCKHVLPGMRARERGVIVNISSMAGLSPGGGAIAYSTSKAGVNSMTKSLALEYAPYGVRVNAIAPGMIDTPMGVDRVARSNGSSRASIAASRAARVPMRRQGTAWDVARAALFLASDDAAFITGVVLPVDGGSTIRGAS